MLTYRDGTPYLRLRRTAAISLTAALAATIALLTLMPVSLPQGVSANDKILHVIAFAALALPCATLYPKALVRVALAAGLYGGLIEIFQPNVGRSGEVRDFIADILGVGLGAALGLVVHWSLKRRLARQTATAGRN